ncbi:MAG: ATP-binding cassette domain-containing protein [Pseudomonadales bacterium]|nr:ATP-binding cassette domain-containing protein [Pseudomonadales bacterium]
MITLTNVALRRGEQLLFQDVSCTIAKGDKVGLVGANGTGKSSLFALIQGELEADEGQMDLPGSLRSACMAQEVVPSDEPAVDYVLAGDEQVASIYGALAEAEAHDEYDRVAELHDQLAGVDGYSARARAEQLLVGLGFSQSELNLPMRSFSGGWQIRMNLARTLMKRSDLLLLDEPTNHLDLDAILWFTDWIRSYDGTMVLISHDRAFLDDCVGRIASLHQQRIELFPGNFAAFERIKAERLAQQQSHYEKQQRQIAHMQDFVRRFRAKATKARQAQSRLKAMERMEAIAPAHVDSPFEFDIPQADKISSPLLQFEDAILGYEEPVLRDVTFSIFPENRIGLLGHNGAGKSTFIKSLAEQLPLLAGVRRQGQNLRLGYFSQQQVDSLVMQRSAFDHIQRLDTKATGQSIRNYLGGYNFHGDRVGEPVSNFSGGEKARLALAMVAYQRPNLLLLDEPTNHLDMDMCQALTVAISAFCEPRTWPQAWPGGAIMLISHDQHLLANVVDEFLIIEHGRVEFFDGDLADYRDRLLGRQEEKRRAPSQKSRATAQGASGNVDHRAGRQLRTRLKTIEKQLERLQRKMNDVESELAKPDIYDRDTGTSLNQLLRDQLVLREQMDDLEAEWLEKSAELEELSG